MSYWTLLLFSFLIFASCGKKSAFTCYICKSTAILDSGGMKKYVSLADYSKCNIDKAVIDKYQLGHNKVDSVAPDLVIDTTTLCSQF